ncbi:MAG: DinB family protein [Bacteroidetes bacterium]|nr:DinB family protein [Bacteroidota bacterium]
MNDMKNVMVKMGLDAWNGYLNRTGKLFDELSDEQLNNEVSPGRNTGIYLYGHLIAVHDSMLPLLGLGEKLYPELEQPFIKDADKSGHTFPVASVLRNYWKEVNAKLATAFATLSADDWFARHMSVSEEDFKNEPHRNKLNVLLSRTSHLASHYGQVVFLQGKSE